MVREVRFFALPAFAFLLLPSLAMAQAEQRPMFELPSLGIEIAQKTSRSEQAVALFNAGKWQEAARLYRDAVKEMPKNSPEAYEAYDMAARLYFYGHNYGDARAMMESAASVAEATGDVVTAAYRHVDAAFIAVWEGYPGSRREHVQRAEQFASSSDVSAEHAARIAALIQGVRALPVSENRKD